MSIIGEIMARKSDLTYVNGNSWTVPGPMNPMEVLEYSMRALVIALEAIDTGGLDSYFDDGRQPSLGYHERMDTRWTLEHAMAGIDELPTLHSTIAYARVIAITTRRTATRIQRYNRMQGLFCPLARIKRRMDLLCSDAWTRIRQYLVGKGGVPSPSGIPCPMPNDGERRSYDWSNTLCERPPLKPGAVVWISMYNRLIPHTLLCKTCLCHENASAARGVRDGPDLMEDSDGKRGCGRWIAISIHSRAGQSGLDQILVKACNVHTSPPGYWNQSTLAPQRLYMTRNGAHHSHSNSSSWNQRDNINTKQCVIAKLTLLGDPAGKVASADLNASQAVEYGYESQAQKEHYLTVVAHGSGEPNGAIRPASIARWHQWTKHLDLKTTLEAAEDAKDAELPCTQAKTTPTGPGPEGGPPGNEHQGPKRKREATEGGTPGGTGGAGSMLRRTAGMMIASLPAAESVHADPNRPRTWNYVTSALATCLAIMLVVILVRRRHPHTGGLHRNTRTRTYPIAKCLLIMAMVTSVSGSQVMA